MRKIFLLRGVLLFLGLFAQSVYAQLTISAELRPRTEFRHGFKALASKNQEAAFFTGQRTRLNLGFQTAEIKSFVSFQDVRIWGNTPQLVNNAGELTGIHQAWTKVKFQKKWALKLGRQELAYDDQRMLGSVGWAQQARSHDAALLIFQDSTFQTHIGLAFNQDVARLSSTLYTLSNNYKTLQFLWLQKIVEQFQFSLLFLNNGLQVVKSSTDYKTNFSQTIGGRIGWKNGRSALYIAAYYQGGTDGDENDTEISAYYLGADYAYL